MRESWIGIVLVLLEGAFFWVILPAVAFALMGSALWVAILCVVKAVSVLRRKGDEAWSALGLSVVALALGFVGVALGYFLYHYYLIPMASQVGR